MGINRVGTVCIFVANQDRALKFYNEKLGMEIRNDQRMGPDSPNRWIAVAPKGADTEMILYLPDENWEHYRQVVGKSQAITLDVSDLDDLYKELKKKDVKFVQEPEMQMYGKYAMIEDSEGNHLILVELPKH